MAGLVLQIIIIAIGIWLLIVSVVSLAKRKMTESFCLVWGFVSVLTILAGVLLRPVGWTNYMSWTGLVLLVLIIGCGIWFVYYLSSKISELMRKNNELAMQVSILVQENTEATKEIAELKEKISTLVVK